MYREFTGAAPLTQLDGGVGTTDTSCVLVNHVGYPDGSSGPFVLVLGRGLPTEEKVLCSGRSGGTVTISERGFDGTEPQAHDDGDPVWHALDADAMNFLMTEADRIKVGSTEDPNWPDGIIWFDTSGA
jgi:hypothetical protein